MAIGGVNNTPSLNNAGAGQESGGSRIAQLEKDIQSLKNQDTQGGGGAQSAGEGESVEEKLKRLIQELAQLKGQSGEGSGGQINAISEQNPSQITP